MKTQNLENNCKVLLIHGLGTVHPWNGKTSETIEVFKERLSVLIKPETNDLSEYIDSDQKYYIAISHSPSQPNETQWSRN